MRDHVDTIAPISAAGPAPGSKYDRLIARAKEARPAITMVAHPCDESSLRGAVEAAELGIIKPVLVGPAAKIRAVAASTASISKIARSSMHRTAMQPRPRPWSSFANPKASS